MTTMHLLEGVMQWTGARTRYRCSILLGIGESTLCRIGKGEQRNLNMATVDHIQRKSGVPFDTLFAWYRLPEGVALGRIDKDAR